MGAALTVLLAIAVVAPGLLPRQRADASKQLLDQSRPVFTSWSPIFRVDAVEVSPHARLLFHDGLLGSAIYRFNGHVSSLGRYKSDPRSFPFAVAATPPANELIIGAAGGGEVLASLYFGAGHIDAIELNPVTYSLVTHDFADYDGHLAENPKANYLKGDGRSFLARSDHTYNLIWFPAPDSYSAMNAATAGAFVLSESYLYTSEAIKDSLDHLGRNGILAAQFGEFDYKAKPNRTTRYVSTARNALGKLGIHDASRHIVVVTTSVPPEPAVLSTILVKAAPFTSAEIDRVVTALDPVPGSKLRYAPGRPRQANSVTEVATLPSSKLDAWYDSYPYDVRPITDDAPFFWHFTPFGDVLNNLAHPIDRQHAGIEIALGERVLVLLLAVATVFAAVFLLLPFVALRNIWVVLPHKKRSAVYFASLGLGFMFFEITLIQRLVLFLGYPTYSLTVTLASLLIFTGVGALLSGRYQQRSKRVVPLLLAAIIVLTAFYEFGLASMTNALLGWPLTARVLIAFIVLAPLGICLGTFMPLGVRAVANLTKFSREYVAWGWAVNGFSTVVGAVLTTILAMAFGFRVVLFLALVVYVIAVAALRGLLRATSTPAPEPTPDPVSSVASAHRSSPQPA